MEPSDDDSKSPAGETKVGKYTFSSDFDSGNGHRWNLVDGEYIVWTRPDADDVSEVETGFKTWFHFYIKGGKKGESITLRIRGLNAHSKLYGRDMRPVVRSVPSDKEWDRVKSSVEYKQDEEKQKIEIKLKHRFEYDDETTYIAFTYPYSYQHCQARLAELEQTFKDHESIYFHRELLCNSVEGNRVDLVTVTERDPAEIPTEREQPLEGLFPDGEQTRPLLHGKDRPVLFVSARVHPGEVPAQWVLEGVMNFVLDPDDPRSKALRENFVVKLLPILNPDGVASGNYRSDNQGLNLNRFYAEPDPNVHPSIYAAKELMMQLHEAGRLKYYFDLHAHACRRGCFIYGNAIPDVKQQIENVLLIRLMALNTPHLDFDGCNFSERNMKAKDKRDGLSKEGSGRVGMYKHTDLTHCYTLECNYNTGRTVNAIPDSVTDDPRCSPGRAPDRRLQPPKYTPGSYMHVGKGICVAVLDHNQLNPWSRVENCHAGSLDGLRAVVANGLASANTELGRDYRRQIKELEIPTQVAKVAKPETADKPKPKPATKRPSSSRASASNTTTIAPKKTPKESEEAKPEKSGSEKPASAGEEPKKEPRASALPRVAQNLTGHMRQQANLDRRMRQEALGNRKGRVMYVADREVAEWNKVHVQMQQREQAGSDAMLHQSQLGQHMNQQPQVLVSGGFQGGMPLQVRSPFGGDSVQPQMVLHTNNLTLQPQQVPQAHPGIKFAKFSSRNPGHGRKLGISGEAATHGSARLARRGGITNHSDTLVESERKFDPRNPNFIRVEDPAQRLAAATGGNVGRHEVVVARMGNAGRGRQDFGILGGE